MSNCSGGKEYFPRKVNRIRTVRWTDWNNLERVGRNTTHVKKLIERN